MHELAKRLAELFLGDLTFIVAGMRGREALQKGCQSGVDVGRLVQFTTQCAKESPRNYLGTNLPLGLFVTSCHRAPPPPTVPTALIAATSQRLALASCLGTVADVDSQPTQMRFDFVRPRPDMTLRLDLSGLWVIATPEPPVSDDDAAAVLTDRGVPFKILPQLGICVQVRHLGMLTSLPFGVTLAPREELRPLVALVKDPPSAPATLTVGRTDLVLEYESSKKSYREDLTKAQAAAFVALEIPFVATSAAWDRLDSLVRLPAVIARASLNLDGYLEITATRPQLVEASPLSGLFRIDPSRFGLPLAAAEQLGEQAGFVLEPLPAPPTLDLTKPSIELSEHATQDLEQLTSSLAHYGARVICWESGLGRRIVALAALEQLDAWPALICTPPSGLWAWQRNLDLLERSYALGPSAADVELSTYTQLSSARSTPSVVSIIFDSPDSLAAQEARPALRRLASRRDALRIALETSWPEDVDEQVAIMELLRPGEFRSDVPVRLRYPPDSMERAHEHIEYYLQRRSHTDDDSAPYPFRRSSTRVVELTADQEIALDEAADRLAYASPSTALSEMFEIVTAGPPHAISPKVTTAVAVASTLTGSVAIVTRSKRAGLLIKGLLRTVTSVEPAGHVPTSPTGIVVIRVDHVWPGLHHFDHVLVLDYPYSLATLDAAVGPAASPGPSTTVFHANGSIDDRMVVLATRRALASGVVDATAPPSLEDIAFLFDPSPV
jgi:hypothetical protein